jgi:hypothetical protein
VSDKKKSEPIQQYLLDLEQPILSLDEEPIMMVKEGGAPHLDADGKQKVYTLKEALRQVFGLAKSMQLTSAEKDGFKNIFRKVVKCQEPTIKIFGTDQAFLLVWLGQDKCNYKAPIGNGQMASFDIFDLDVQDQVYNMVKDAPKVDSSPSEVTVKQANPACEVKDDGTVT